MRTFRHRTVPRVYLLAICLSILILLPVSAGEEDHASSDEQLVKAVRKVVERIAVESEKNAKATNENKLSGDALTESYVQSAALAASQLPVDVAPKAFLIGLGVACDHTDSLRNSPLLGAFDKRVEGDEERQRHQRHVGRPTVLEREDLALHFLVSAYLTARLGPAAAEAAGLAKEVKDAQDGSGFSFADLAADRAGIRFAQRTLAAEISLEDVARHFKVTDFMPDIQGLDEGISLEQFQRDYGSTSDERFQSVVRDIDARIARLVP